MSESYKCKSYINEYIEHVESLGKNEYVTWVSNFNEYAIVIFNDAIVLELGSSDWDHDDFFVH